MTETNFKHTDLGLIPHDWEVKTIGSIADVKTGPFGSALHASDYVAKGTPIITVEHIGEASILHTKEIPQVGESDTIRLKAYTLKEGDLVFSRVGSVDRCGYIAKEEEGWLFSGRLLRVRPIEDISSKYLTYHLNSKPARDRVLSVAVGLAMPSINTKILEGVSVALPPTIAEQERIAGALSSIDTLIGALTEQIEKKRHIKQGAMQQLLTGKKRLAGFTGEWKSVKLRELCQLFGRIGFRGYTKNDLVEKGMGAITFSPSDIHNQKIDYSNCDYISFHKYEESPEIKVFNGDIIFGKTASIGKCAIIDKLEEKATINPQFVVLKKFKCNNYFLYYKLIDKPFQTQVLAICGGSTIPTMSQEKLKEQELWFPPTIAEQSAIAAVLSNMDTEIAALEQKRDKYIAIKSGMMQNLLTGKIRLV
jgi:type I restriction enzyme S subunit